MKEETKKDGALDAATKAWIDNCSYEGLLAKWRFAPSGDPLFQGETGKYYSEVMFKKRDADPAGAVQASKNLGWDP